MTGPLRVLVAAVLLAASLVPVPAPAAPADEEPVALASDPDYVAGRAAIAAKDWERAIAALTSAALRHLREPDVHNALGYAYRHAGRMDRAFRHYRRALELDPNHRGAHEYLGEAYLMVGNVEKATEHLAILRRLCPTRCEERDDLEKAITAHRGRPGT